LSREDHLWREAIKRAAIAQKAAGEEFVPTIPERSWRSHFFDVFTSPYLLLTTYVCNRCARPRTKSRRGLRKPSITGKKSTSMRADLENKLRAAGIGNIHHIDWGKGE
jgi:hypothetical protein